MCDVCQKSKPRTAYNAGVWANEHKYGRNLRCIACYTCAVCGEIQERAEHFEEGARQCSKCAR